MKLVIVESPNKAKSIQKYLGSEYRVLASNGHIRDIEKLEGNSIGVDFATWEANYAVPPDKKRCAAAIKKEAASADVIYLCSDADREGEAISWHISQLLGSNRRKARRAKYTEVTKKAVTEALARAGSIDMPLVEAQQTRRIIDRIVGFQASAVLNAALGRGQATGRVQAAALALICKRQREILNFVPVEYFTVECAYPEGFTASYFVEGGRADEGEEEEEEEKDDAKAKGGRIFNRDAAEEIANVARTSPHVVASVEKKEVEARPKAPFTTSTMTQAATSQLGRSLEEVSAAAQRLFEGGLITYHRTDSPAVDVEFQAKTLAWLKELEGEARRAGEDVTLCPTAPRVAKQKANAQGAHECIRPTDLARLPTREEGIDNALYTLIFWHYAASQAASALDSVTYVTTQAGPHKFRAVGRRQLKPGFRWLASRATGRKTSDVEMPPVSRGAALGTPDVALKENVTKPPSLFREADYIRVMEKEGVGRPSTYGSTLKALLNRKYVGQTKQRRLFVTEAGERALTFMETNMPELPHVAYTAEIERQLDEVAEGKTTRKTVLGSWYDIWRNTVQNAADTLRAGATT